MDWLRWYRGTCLDPKFTIISRACGQPKHAVIAVWAYMLETALQASPRGSIASWDNEDAAAALDLAVESTKAIHDALAAKMLIGEGRVIAWKSRQYDKENSTERTQRFRAKEADGTHGNAAERTGTQQNAPEEKRGEEKREDIKSLKTEVLASLRASKPRVNWTPENRKARWEQKIMEEVNRSMPDDDAQALIAAYIAGESWAKAQFNTISDQLKAAEQARSA